MHRLGAGAEAMVLAKKLTNEFQLIVLKALVSHYDEAEYRFTKFGIIAKETGLPVKTVRRVTRALARKGLAEYSTLFSEYTGLVCGSGYAATAMGKVVLTLKEPGPTKCEAAQ
jgi:hypothetical protein